MTFEHTVLSIKAIKVHYNLKSENKKTVSMPARVCWGLNKVWLCKENSYGAGEAAAMWRISGYAI
jgi:hypothetical protein